MNNNIRHNLSTIAIMGFAALSSLYIESKSQTLEEKLKLYFISHAIITASLITRFITETSVLDKDSRQYKKELKPSKNISFFHNNRKIHSDSDIYSDSDSDIDIDSVSDSVSDIDGEMSEELTIN